MGSRNALIVDTGTPYWPRGTYNYKGMTRRKSELSRFLIARSRARPRIHLIP